MLRKRLLHLTFDMHIGGAEQVIKNLVENMDKARYDVSILCLEQPIGPFGQMLMEKGFSISVIPRKDGFDASVVFKLRKFLINNRIDILHCHQYTPWAYGALAASFTSTQVLFTEHGRFFPDRSSWKRRIVNPILLMFTKSVTAICQATSEALVNFEFIPSKRIEVIYNGIQPIQIDPGKALSIRDKLGIPNDSKIIGTIARLDPVKNQAMMLRAFQLVINQYPKIVLLVVGDGEEMQNLRQLARSLNIDNNVIFTGYIDRPEHHLFLMDIFLLSSLTEGTSMTLLEAMSIGKPCIVTDAGGNPEIIKHQYNGLVAENNNMNEFASAILKLLTDESLRDAMGKNAILRFNEKFTVKKMTSQFDRKYMQSIL